MRAGEEQCGDSGRQRHQPRYQETIIKCANQGFLSYQALQLYWLAHCVLEL
jgi:hypothetical protein